MDHKTKRAEASAGTHSGNIADWICRDLAHAVSAATEIIDIGCGVGNLGRVFRDRFGCTIDGVDLVKYDQFASESYRRHSVVDLDAPFSRDISERYDIALAIEVVEHLENPRALLREASALLRKGGLLVVTTPNVRSLSSLLTMILQGHFRDFRAGVGMYPCHITPLSDLDAVRIATEMNLVDVEVRFSGSGRVPLSLVRYQNVWPWLRGRLFSDTYMLLARTPGS